VERSGAGLGQGDAGGPQALEAGDVGVGRDLARVGAPLHDPVGLVDEDDPGRAGAAPGAGPRPAMATSLVLPRAVPFRISAPLDLLIVTAFIAISVIGGFISVRVISRIDPVEAIS